MTMNSKNHKDHQISKMMLIEQTKKLSGITGMGLLDCIMALKVANNDYEKAKQSLEESLEMQRKSMFVTPERPNEGVRMTIFEYKDKRVQFDHEKYGKSQGEVIAVVNEEVLMVKPDSGDVIFLYPYQVQVIEGDGNKMNQEDQNIWLVEYLSYIMLISAESKIDSLRKAVEWYKKYDPEKLPVKNEHLLFARKATEEDLEEHSLCEIIYEV